MITSIGIVQDVMICKHGHEGTDTTIVNPDTMKSLAISKDCYLYMKESNFSKAVGFCRKRIHKHYIINILKVHDGF